jgi:hypothetical protein
MYYMSQDICICIAHIIQYANYVLSSGDITAKLIRRLTAKALKKVRIYNAVCLYKGTVSAMCTDAIPTLSWWSGLSASETLRAISAVA